MGEVRDLLFYQWVLGTDRLGWNLGKLALSLVGYVAVLGPIVAVALRVREPVQGGQRLVLAVVGLALGATAAVWPTSASSMWAARFP